MINISLINTYYRQGGASIACTRLWQALNESGVHTDLLNLFSEEGVNHTSFLSGRSGKLISKYHFIKERLYFLRYERDSVSRWNFSPANTGVDVSDYPPVRFASVLHLHWINHGFLSLKSLKKLSELNKPIVWTLHDMWLFTGGCHHSRGCENYLVACGNCQFLKRPYPDDLSSEIFYEKQKLLSKMKLHVVTPSKWLAERASASGLLKDKKISVIPNPLDINLYKPSEKKLAKKSLGLSEDSKVILFMAANVSSEYKGVTYLEQALRLLKQQNKDLSENIVLLVVGRVKNDVFKNYPVKIICTGAVNDEQRIISYFNASDLFLLPSLEENLPNTIMEAMACGTPSVAFRTGGIPDLIDHMENGYLAEFRSAEDIKNGISTILSDSELSKKMQINARKKVEENYSYRIVAAKYKEIYESCLKSV